MIFELVWVTLASATCWLAGYYLLRMWQIPNPLRVVLATADRALWKGVPCGNYCLLPGRLTGAAKRGER